MKKILTQYPKQFHQIILLFLVEQICFSWLISISDPAFSSGGLGDYFIGYYSIAISLIYLLAGWSVDKIQDFRKGLHYGIGFLFVAWLLSLFGGDLGFIGLTILAYFGHSIFYFFCLIHVSLFFPVANDWKDFAFFLMMLLPLIISPLLVLLLSPLFTSGFFPVDINFLTIGTPLTLGGLYYLLTLFKDLGYKIEDDEHEGETEIQKNPVKNDETKSSIKTIMIGIVSVGVLLSFIGSKLSQLKIEANRVMGGGLDDLIGSMTGYSQFYLVQVVALLGFLIFGFVYMSNFSSHQSKQIVKIDRTIFFLFGLILLNLFSQLTGNHTTDYFIESSFLYTYHLLFLPILLSIITHVNLDENLGLWLAALVGLPTLFSEIIQYIVPSAAYHILPFVALGLLILFRITLKENKVFIKEKLALDTPNQIEEDDNEVDILDHFVEK